MLRPLVLSAMLTACAPPAPMPPAPAAPPPAPPARAVVPVAEPEPPPKPPFLEPMPEDVPAQAARYSRLSPVECRRELRERALPFEPSKRFAGGVATPLVFTGPLHGVRFVAPGGRTPYGIVDCRLALALDELARVLDSLGVAAVRIDSMYRPNAKLSRRRGRSQHAYGLAIDILALELRDGRVLSVERDWHAPLPSVACGPEAVMIDASDEAVILRNILCTVRRSRIFHTTITPSDDAAHRTHFHFDIKRPK